MSDIQQITRSLMRWVVKLSYARTLVLPNTYVLGSPWECDVLHVLKSLYYVEYEIKLSMQDYYRDFAKRTRFWRSAPKKHDIYAAKKRMYFRNKEVMKPKRFVFVTPVGMISPENIPAYCGNVTFKLTDSGYEFRWARKPPNLRYPAKLSAQAVYNLALKAAWRCQE